MLSVRQRHQQVCKLADWECILLSGHDLHKKETVITVFTMDGRSETFDDVQLDTVDVRVVGRVGGFKVLSFKTLDFRTINILDVSYWVVDEK